MGREKRNPVHVDADGTLSPAVTGDGTGAALPDLGDILHATVFPDTAEPATQTHTRDRDPANREAWKRERAKQLGYTRD